MQKLSQCLNVKADKYNVFNVGLPPISKPLFRPFLGRGDDQGGGCPTPREFHGHLDIHTDKDNYPK